MHRKLYNTKLLYIYIVSLISMSEGFSNDLQSGPNILRRTLLSSESLPFEDCGSRYEVLYIDVSNCDAIPCKMARGSTVTVTVIFDDNGHQTSLLRHHVRWILNAIKTNAIITPDPCADNDDCLNEDRDGTSYTAKVFVSKTLPNISGTMMWVAVDQTNTEVICFRIPILITASSLSN
ncbi:NPC intracellular cholesterol transporter 2 [Eurosta solidaginis]|uniref:NPC intracellular cholesterol transporter 2 n=1 Tax=Eurosta solidaginis TaxID=178769 RepID=UPI0035315403